MGCAYFVHAYPKKYQQPAPIVALAPEIKKDEPVEKLSIDEQVNIIPAVSAATILEEKNKDPIIPLAERNKNPLTRLDEAKEFAKPQILTGKYIDISLKFQNMVIFEDGKVLDAYQISSGKKGMDTPIGTFKVENKTPRAWSKDYGLWMPNWMAILPSGKVGIHELPIWPGGYQEGAKHLGTPVSHGCVRLGKDAAKRVYDWVEIGTPVVIH